MTILRHIEWSMPVVKKSSDKENDIPPVYSAWFGKPVVLLVVVRRCRVPLPCSIVGETAADVRIRIKPGWEMDVRKEVILAVEEFPVPADIQFADHSARPN